MSNEIAQQVVSSTTPTGPEGIPNCERFRFICHILEVDGLRMADEYDFDACIASGDPAMVTAGRFLATLQHEYSTRCFMAGVITEKQHEEEIASLGLAIAKMRWAYSFLANGRTNIPPYPFLN